MKMGCKTRKEAAITSHVFLELCEVKKYWDVEYHFNEILSSMYITAKKTKSSKTLTFIPISSFDGISIEEMKKYLILDQEHKSVHLAIVDSDLTSVYYQITDGIGDPTPESQEESIKDRRMKLDGDLRSNKKILEEAAMYGIPITINKK
ncbi:uncharacterized protein [Onthophagus taurus]